jgi:hypothetical protein
MAKCDGCGIVLPRPHLAYCPDRPSVNGKAAEVLEEPDEDTIAVAADGFRLTDAGNALRLVDLCPGCFRFAHAWGGGSCTPAPAGRSTRTTP